MIAAAVIGLGRIGSSFEDDPLRFGAVTHAGGWARHPAAELVGGVDPSSEARAAFERRFGAPTYASLDELLAVGVPDAVSVATVPELHAPAVLACIDAGVRRVLCEKPFTPDLASARALVAELGEDRHQVGVNFTRRYDPVHRYVLGRLAADDLRSGQGRYTAGIRNTASHWLECLVAAGAEVERVAARPSGSMDGDPSPHVLLELVGGGLVTLHGLPVSDYLVFEMDLAGAATGARLTASGSVAVASDVVDSPMYSGYRELRPSSYLAPLGLSNPMLSVIDDVVMSIEDDRPIACTVDTAVAVHQIIEAVLRSLDGEGWVALASV